ncbi:MAG: replication-associated recombination protein A [Elusimicrobia bacterium]|nr:replication-associated recombination protein A [Candidatus Liberimonas magnetica]
MKLTQTDFFATENKTKQNNVPLALKITPNNIDELVGQENILGKDKLLRRLIESDRLNSVIFYGPPGTGKSALARIIAKQTKAHFEETNAVTIGINEIRNIIKQSKSRLDVSGQKTILLLDEIHHFNRTQQDALLPDVERGAITLIGITTENPFFYINQALISRSTLFEFKPLDTESLKKILERVINDKEIGFGNVKLQIGKGVVEHLISKSNGDARKLINALEIGVLSTKPDQEGIVNFDLKVAEESLQQKVVLYDKSSDEHYDHISAFIKSMRGSDPDAALYWMAKMLTAGEDPRFIARRIIICASEDVGNADPNALTVAASALKAVEFVGMPEARIPLAQAVTYIATAPKSNASYLAIEMAQNEVKNSQIHQVPDHLKDSNLDGEARGHGKGYKYPHDFPGHFVKQEYWPGNKVFYEPSEEGYEKKIKERLAGLRQKKENTGQAPEKKK